MIIAVTGNTGSGKSSLTDLFVRWGGKRIDADRIGRDVWENDRDAGKRIARELGPEVLGPDGKVDRRLLGRAVFADPEELAAFDRIVQPVLKRRIARMLAEAAEENDTIWVLDAALLFEWEMEESVDRVVVVAAGAGLRARRIADRHGISAAEARNRIDRQTDEAEKIRRADHVVMNEGTREELEEKARALWKEITSPAR